MTTAPTTNEKGNGCNPVPFQNHTTNAMNFPIADASSKALATLKAQMALAGHSVYDGGNDDFIVVKAGWCMSRHCPDIAALRAFARLLGASHGPH